MAYKKSAKGSLYLYNGSQTITVNTQNEYHAVLGLLAGDLNGGFTYTASATGSITSTANNGGVLRCTDVGHGLTTGQFVTLNGMGDSAHNGITRVTVIDPDTFDCDDIVYNSAADTGSWQRGASLTVNPGYGGVYDVSFSISASSAVSNKDFKVECYKNTVPLDEFATERLFGNTGWGVVASSGVVLFNAGDIIWIALENTTDTQDCIIKHMNLHLNK